MHSLWKLFINCSGVQWQERQIIKFSKINQCSIFYLANTFPVHNIPLTSFEKSKNCSVLFVQQQLYSYVKYYLWLFGTFESRSIINSWTVLEIKCQSCAKRYAPMLLVHCLLFLYVIFFHAHYTLNNSLWLQITYKIRAQTSRSYTITKHCSKQMHYPPKMNRMGAWSPAFTLSVWHSMCEITESIHFSLSNRFFEFRARLILTVHD